ncbi:MAG: TylF/MycF/NovP-related O-methyltransferase [bacterium]
MKIKCDLPKIVLNEGSEQLYLALLRNTLMRITTKGALFPEGSRKVNYHAVLEGRDFYDNAETMIGIARLENIRFLVEDILRNDIPGDLLEAGVWRGGAVIYMRGILAAYGIKDRNVWVADSFQGLPKPNPEAFPADQGDIHWTRKELKISRKIVEENFSAFDLLDDQVKFLEGWFKDTLYEAPVEKLALLRVDGDMYESTWQALEALYPHISPGGYCIVDDYGAISNCKKAVDDFRGKKNIEESLTMIDWTGVYWKKQKELTHE